MTVDMGPYSREVGSQAEVPDIFVSSRGSVSVRGYQVYQIRAGRLASAKSVHRIKYQMIRPHLLHVFHDRRIVDIGCSAGIIGVQAILDQCPDVNFVDHDPEYIAVVRRVLGHLGRSEAQAHVSSLGKFHEQFDVGVALALIHWIYSYSEVSGSLKRAVGLLHRVAPEALFVEWVSPEDAAIKQANHIGQNAELIDEPYDVEHFKSALREYYSELHFVGRVSDTREIWLASNRTITTPKDALLAADNEVERLRRLGDGGVFGRLRNGLGKLVLFLRDRP